MEMEKLLQKWKDEDERRGKEGQVFGGYILIGSGSEEIERAAALMKIQADVTNDATGNKIKEIMMFVAVEGEIAVCGWTGIIPKEEE